jgi:hypothetical protein
MTNRPSQCYSALRTTKQLVQLGFMRPDLDRYAALKSVAPIGVQQMAGKTLEFLTIFAGPYPCMQVFFGKFDYDIIATLARRRFGVQEVIFIGEGFRRLELTTASSIV